MTDLESTARETDTVRSAIEQGPRRPASLRGLGILGLAALLVALYALFQLRTTSSAGGSQRFELPAAGLVAPDIDVPLFDGGRFSLSEHLAEDGRPVFVNMWASWCFPCRAEMPEINKIAAEHPEVFFIGIAVDDRVAPARDFVEEYDISYAMGWDERPVGDEADETRDEGRSVEKAYVIWNMPRTYLIGSDGLIIERWFGPMRTPQLEEFVKLASATES